MRTSPPQNPAKLNIQRLVSKTWLRLLRPECYIPVLLVTVICAITGPFGTLASDPLWFRFVFWGSVSVSSTTLALFFSVLGHEKFPDGPFYKRALFGGSIFVFVFTPIIWKTIQITYPNAQLPSLWTLLVLVTSITVGVYGIMWIFMHNVQKEIETQPSLKTTPTQTQSSPQNANATLSFLSKLGPHAGTKLIRLSMNDHYIEVFTENGQHLVYMRFSDAVDQLDPTIGAQVHRSHWVTFSEIKGVLKDGQKLSLKMSDGAVVPISRRRKQELQQIGVL